MGVGQLCTLICSGEFVDSVMCGKARIKVNMFPSLVISNE